MKYIRLYSTSEEFNNDKASLEKPYVCYVEETGDLHFAKDARHVIIMTAESNPSVLAICYAQGWCASPDKMTQAEAEAVTSIGTAFKASNIGDFTEFQYFTGLTSIPSDAFQNSQVTRLYMPDTVTSLGHFRNVTKLQELKLSEGLTALPQYFSIPCALHIPKNLASMYFSLTTNMSYVDISVDPANIYFTYEGGILYTTAVVPEIKGQVYNQTSVNIKEGVQSLPSSIMEENRVVTSLTLPSSMQAIGARFCRSATNLKTLTVMATTPPTLSSSYLLQNVTLNAIRVPSASVDAYKAESVWSNYANIITGV